MNILAIVVPHNERHTDDYSMLNFPLGLAYVVAAIRKRRPEVNVKVMDFACAGILSQDAVRDELKRAAGDFSPDYVIYGGMITRFSYLSALGKVLKEIFPGAKQVMGGSAAGSGYKFFLKDNIVDYFVSGEGEEAVIGVIEGNPAAYKNIFAKNSGAPAQAQIIPDIDSLAFPSYRDFEVERYIASNRRYTGWRFMPMIASRGCPFSCGFCYPNFGNTVRIRNENSVVEEMALLKSEYRVDSVCFWDEVQFLDKAWMERFCRQLFRRQPGLKWSCVSRVSLLDNRDIPLLRLAKKAGCLRIAVGIESGNQDMLDRMNKQNSISRIESAIRCIRDAGIKATGTMLAGYPGETPETIRDSVNFANRNLLKTSFYCLIPLPGSKIYADCLREGSIVDEYKYLQQVSSSKGDASNILINLTKMNDAEYRKEVESANKSVSGISARRVFQYYGLWRGLFEYLRSLCVWVNLKLKGRMFETP